MDILANIYIAFALIIGLYFLGKIVKSIINTGFTCGNMMLSILMLFYVILPLVYLLVPNDKNSKTLFNRLLYLNEKSDIAICTFVCLGLIALFYIVYKHKSSIYISVFNSPPLDLKKNISACDWDRINSECYDKILTWTNIIFVVSSISIILCVIDVGGLSNYLALGSKTRGLNKNVTDYISSALLPFITLSSIILAVPYMYSYLINLKKTFSLTVRYWFSIIIATIYLIYNQGKLPILLFFIPFILNSKIAKKQKVLSLVLLTLFSVFLLDPLEELFAYISFNRTSTNKESVDLVTTFLEQFSYPFVNFLNRGRLVEHIEFRLGIDYVAWPILVIPSSVLKIFGISRSGFTTLQLLNTNAYEKILGESSGGGIPADFFTFNYYQFGWISLIVMTCIASRFLRSIDERGQILKTNSPIAIIYLRLCFLLISLINNFDFSVLCKMRFDFVILTIVVFYVARNGVSFKEKSEIGRNI